MILPAQTIRALKSLDPERVKADLAAMERLDGIVMIPAGWKPNDYADFLKAEKARRAASVEAITAGAGR